MAWSESGWPDEPHVDGMKLVLLVDDARNPLMPDLAAKHGLSMFVELYAGGHVTRLLMDAGQSAEAVLRNAEKLGIDLRGVDAILLSHGHYDHTGGLIGILQHVGRPVPVITHPRALEPKFVLRRKRLKEIGIPFKASEIRRSNGLLSLGKDARQLSPGAWASGEIERLAPFEGVEGFKARRRGKLVNDQLPDDQALFVNLGGKGLVVITGCAHAGLINTVMQGLRVTGSDALHAVVGGFHLARAGASRMRATVKELLKMGPRAVMPCHCTGSKAMAQLAEAFGERFRRLRTGDSVQF
jgi:7,8-dihydropterin-6-yl-methyl-4-(beta-D-ribofuranosyl)aminobenzene 5'-phosphate synthase